jgi:hypothetical protein
VPGGRGLRLHTSSCGRRLIGAIQP